MARELKRLNMNMPAELLQKVDEFADQMALNRTSAITVLVSTALEQKNSFSMMDELLKKLEQVEENA